MSILDPDLTSLAFCWRLERRDGVALGFTSHDRDLWFGTLVYRAAPGMLPSAVSASSGLEASALDVTGALTSDSIRTEDLSAGRWDGAAVHLLLVDWERPEAQSVPLARGILGSVTVKGNGFTAELRGPGAMLERPVVELTSPTCRAELGDKRCRVDMAARVAVSRVSAVVSEDSVELDFLPGDPAGYANGRLRWLGGANSGLESAIWSAEGRRVVLFDPPPFTPAAGDMVEVREGCDKLLSTCSGRFRNVENFRGEPHLPGMDLLTRYPGA